MIKSILTFLFPNTIASIKQDGVNQYCDDEDRRLWEEQEERWKEIDEYEERMRIESEQELESSMKTFDDLSFETMNEDIKWIRASMKFYNGYGVSVVRGPHSYGGQRGLYELAVLDSDGEITYGTHITDDVLGFLAPDDVTRHMIEIQELPIIHTNTQTK